jgi:hypothetical protein
MSLVAALMLAQVVSQPPAPPMPPAPPAPAAAPAPPSSPLQITPVPAPDRPLGPDIGVGTDELGEEIVILARKLRLVHVHLLRTSHDGDAICNVLRSSGDTEVDQLTCDAAKACAQKLPDRKTPPEKMIQCTREEQARRVEELAERRIEEEFKN